MIALILEVLGCEEGEGELLLILAMDLFLVSPQQLPGLTTLVTKLAKLLKFGGHLLFR